MSQAPTQLQINTQEIEITLKLKVSAIGVVIGGLEQVPLGHSRPVYDYIVEQTNIQVGAFVAQKQAEAAGSSDIKVGGTD